MEYCLLIFGLIQVVDVKFNLGILSQDSVQKYIGEKNEKKFQLLVGFIMIAVAILLFFI